jgi:small subunit ribosomal protein S20
MAKSKTPMKRAKQAEANRLRNTVQKSRLKNAVKKYRGYLTEADPAAAGEALVGIVSLIDKNVSKGLMHRNTAARKKSALTRQYNALKKTAAEAPAAE